jgi:xanthine dehydrogenase YagR molybdenum-binding subunit
MKFDKPAGPNPIDQLKVIGKPHDRVEGRLKVSGTAVYAYERREPGEDMAYGYVVGAGIAKGRISSIHASEAKAAPGAPATIQRIQIGATRDGKITAIGHESLSGNLPEGRTEPTTLSTR